MKVYAVTHLRSDLPEDPADLDDLAFIHLKLFCRRGRETRRRTRGSGRRP